MAMAAADLLSTVAPKIEKIFGSKDIKDVLGNFNWDNVSVSEKQDDAFVHCDLAPSLGKLNKAAVMAMDENLKVIIAGTTRTIEQLPKGQRNWEDITSALGQNVLLEPLDDGITRSDKLIKDSGLSAFKFDGAPDESIMREVHTWFTTLVSDEDVLKSTKIDIDFLAKIVAWTGATVEDFETVFAKNEYHEQRVVDIGVLRYPDFEHPFFKVYRIKLTA
ncbi:hypothetical protein BGZ99_002439, partial [Dissophora globulifera]